MKMKTLVSVVLVSSLSLSSIALAGGQGSSTTNQAAQNTRSVAEIQNELKELDSKLAWYRVEQGVEALVVVASAAVAVYFGNHAVKMTLDPNKGGLIYKAIMAGAYLLTAAGASSAIGLGTEVYQIQTSKIPELRKQMQAQIAELEQAKALEEAMK